MFRLLVLLFLVSNSALGQGSLVLGSGVARPNLPEPEEPDPGDLTHGESYIISGSGFGVKSSNTLIWDNADHGQSVGTRWSGSWPTILASNYNFGYFEPSEVSSSVEPAHSRATNYITGAHAGTGGAAGGYNVGMWRTFTVNKANFPLYSVWVYYTRIDPGWDLTVPPGPGDDDNNFKWYGLGAGGDYYSESPNNWYLGAPSQALTLSGVNGWAPNDDAEGTGMNMYGFAYEDSDMNEPNQYSVEPNLAQNWIKHELMVIWEEPGGGDELGGIYGWTSSPYTPDAHGLDYQIAGYTDGYSGTTRSEGIGGYTRLYSVGANNMRRYWNDVYYDYGSNPERIVLANNATLASATIVEPQPWTSWSDTSVTITVNAGALSAGTVYLHRKGYNYATRTHTSSLVETLTLN